MHQGFTLIEVLVTLSITIALSSIMLFVSMDSFRSVQVRSEHSKLVTMLLHARAQALHGVCDKETCTSPQPVVVNYGTSSVEFAAYSGDASSTGPIPVADGFGHESITTVSSEGRITWTH